MSRLIDADIKVLINLLTRAEFEEARFYHSSAFPNYLELMNRVSEKRRQGLRCSRHPIRDMGVPSKPQMKAILDTIDGALARNHPVYIHCYAGLGRTGTVAGCWLVRQGLGGDQALKELNAIRREQGAAAYGISPQNDLQRDFVRRWNKGE